MVLVLQKLPKNGDSAHPRGKVDGARSYRVAMVGTAAIAIQSIANPNSTTKKRLLVVGGGLCVGAGRKTA
jgi:hypothetical protein